MVLCPLCQNKIGIFDAKIELNNGNIAHKRCYDAKIELEKKKQKAILEQKRKEKQAKAEKLKRQIIPPILEKYLGNKSTSHLLLLLHIKNLYKDGMISKSDDLRMIKISLQVVFENLMPEELELLDEMSSLEKDFPKLKKLIESKGISISRSRLLKMLGSLAEEKIKEERKRLYREMVKPIYVRIKNKLEKESLSLNDIVREVYNCPLDIPIDEELISTLFESLEIKATKKEISSAMEKAELKKFEEQLDKPISRNIPDYEHLNPLEFEDWLRKLFTQLEYKASVTKASGDQGADLIISRGGKKTVVQAKKYQGPVPNKAVQEVIAAKAYYDADNAIVITTGSFTNSAKELANKANVELWNSLKLKEVLGSIKSRAPIGEFTSSTHYDSIDEDDYANFSCPFCQGNMSVLVRELSETQILKCEHCGVDIEVESSNKGWACEYCNARFGTLEEAEEHEKSCPKRTS